MRGPGSRLSRGVGRMMLGATAIAAAAALLVAPVAVATPDSDASDAIDQAWQAIGGDESTLGTKDGDVYAIGDGFGQNFADGVYYFTPATGAHMLYGDVLAKYRALGGAADSDLGFPTIDEVTGLVGPDSRVSTFSASDRPAIFWTPDTGAWVVRGAINAAWDKLGGSAGVLGVPIGDETYNGDVVDQKFANGELSWNRATKMFATVPADLAGQLADVMVPTDATSAISEAWRAAGGLGGSLGARQGAQYSIGDAAAAQPYVGGKIFYSPATGAHAVTGAILAKYESAGGPTGDLGYPVGTESDGGAPNSRVSAFSADDKPVIFWTPDAGAIVVRGAINAAWTQLGGAAGKLGVPTGQQAVKGDTVTQSFSAGQLSWNKSTGKFTSNPSDIASSLSGVEIPKGAAAGVPSDDSNRGFVWHWWWLLVIIPGFLLIGVIAFGVVGWRRRREARKLSDWPHELESGPSIALSAPAVDDWSAAKTMPGVDDVFDGDQDSLDTTPTRLPAHQGEPRDGLPTDESDDLEPAVEAPLVEEFDEPLDVEEEEINDEDDALDESSHTGRTDADELAPDELAPDDVVPDGMAPDGIDAEVDADVDRQLSDLRGLNLRGPDFGRADFWGTYFRSTDVKDGNVGGSDPADKNHDAANPEDEAVADLADADESPQAGRHSAHSAGEARFVWTIDAQRPSGRRRARSEGPDSQDVRDSPSAASRRFETRSVARHTKPDARHTKPDVRPSPHVDFDPSKPAIHLPLSDPYQPPEGYPIKANTHSGLYYTPDCDLYDHTVPEVWFASEELAQANGFVKAE